MNLADLADEELVAKVQEQGAGPAGAFDELLRRHTPLLRSYFRSAWHPAEDASDLCQEVWVRVWRWLSDPDPARRFDPARGSFRHVLLQVARSVAVDWFRRRQREPAGAVPARRVAEQPDQDSDMIVADLLEAVDRKLDEKERTVLSYLRKGTPISQICEATGLSQPTVWRIQQRLRQAFRNILDA
jgi:RNA polymerase sigma factor (sigma-70 family)